MAIADQIVIRQAPEIQSLVGMDNEVLYIPEMFTAISMVRIQRMTLDEQYLEIHYGAYNTLDIYIGGRPDRIVEIFNAIMEATGGQIPYEDDRA